MQPNRYEYVWAWIRRYPLWYLGIVFANLFALVILLPYRLFNTYILFREVDLSGWGYVLFHFTGDIHRPSMPFNYVKYKKELEEMRKASPSPDGIHNVDINSMYPSAMSGDGIHDFVEQVKAPVTTPKFDKFNEKYQKRHKENGDI